MAERGSTGFFGPTRGSLDTRVRDSLDYAGGRFVTDFCVILFLVAWECFRNRIGDQGYPSTKR